MIIKLIKAIAWLALCFLVGKYAEKKGKGLWTFAIISLLFTPVVGFLIVWVMDKKKETESTPKEQEHKEHKEEAPTAVQSRLITSEGASGRDFSAQTEKLLQLKDLLDKGVLTQAEFDKMKKEILEGPAGGSKPILQGKYVFKAKQLNTAEKVLNLGLHTEGLEYFEYDNGHLYVKMQDGKTLNSDISKVAANFSKIEGDIVICTLQSGTQMVSIYMIWHLLDEEDWWNLFNILTHCGAVFNLDGYLKLYNAYHSKLGRAVRLTGIALNSTMPFIE